MHSRFNLRESNHKDKKRVRKSREEIRGIYAPVKKNKTTLNCLTKIRG